MAAENRREINTRLCTRCGNEYRGHPAISRVDNITPICPICGTREALEALNISKEEIEKIVAGIPTFEDK